MFRYDSIFDLSTGRRGHQYISDRQAFTIGIKNMKRQRLDGPVFSWRYAEWDCGNGPQYYAAWKYPLYMAAGYGYLKGLSLLVGLSTTSRSLLPEDPNWAICWIISASTYTFNVRAPGLPERWGLIYMPSEWSFTRTLRRGREDEVRRKKKG